LVAAELEQRLKLPCRLKLAEDAVALRQYPQTLQLSFSGWTESGTLPSAKASLVLAIMTGFESVTVA